MYFLTALSSKVPGRERCVGIFVEGEGPESIEHTINFHSSEISEDGYWDLLVLEEGEMGMYPTLKQIQWYAWNHRMGTFAKRTPLARYSDKTNIALC